MNGPQVKLSSNIIEAFLTMETISRSDLESDEELDFLHRNKLVRAEGGFLVPIKRLNKVPLDSNNALYLFGDLPYEIPTERSWPWVDEGALLIRHVQQLLRKTSNRGLCCLDLCCGVGSVAIGLSHLMKTSEVVGVDLDDRAIEFAHLNHRINYRPNTSVDISWHTGDLFEPLEGDHGPFDLIVADPPFALEPAIEGEEWSAGERGIDVTTRILQQVGSHLKEGGYFLMPMYSLKGRSGLEAECILKGLPDGDEAWATADLEESAWYLLKDERVWRFAESKILTNPTAIDRLIVRACDPVRSQSFYSKDPARNEQVIQVYRQRVDRWQTLLTELKAQGFDELWYVMIVLKKVDGRLCGAVKDLAGLSN